MNKQYLGDGVYVEWVRSHGIVLTTEDGVAVTNRIVLEPEIYEHLRQYVEGLLRATTREGNPT